MLSSADFPALPTSSAELLTRPEQPPQPPVSRSSNNDEDTQAKLERREAKKAAAADRAAEKEKIAQERALERERAAKEKERVAKEKDEEKARLTRERAEERERMVKDKAAEKARIAKEKAEKEKAALHMVEKEKAAIVAAVAAANAKDKGQDRQDAMILSSTIPPAPPATSNPRAAVAKKPPSPSGPVGTPSQVPILSKMPKKNKPTSKPIKIPKEDDILRDGQPGPPSAVSANPDTSPQSHANTMKTPHVSEVVESHHHSGGHGMHSHTINVMSPTDPMPLDELLEQIDASSSIMNITKHAFFDVGKINPAAKMPLEYGPLVHALSALSVGGGSFANNMPTGSIDNAVSSFQQLLETLTQTISDLLRLLPRTTWDDSSSFDGVLRDMLKGDDFLDEAGDDGNGRDDEVAALTLALERRARWMEVQLAKLEELHRDINTAAVRAVLAFNDRGWDAVGFLPRVGNTLARFDHLGLVEERGSARPMTIDELEKRLVVAKEAMVFAETEVRETMEDMQALLPVYED